MKPPPDLRLSEWADEYRKLSAESSAEPGQWRTERAPYLRAIMDATGEPEVEEITLMKSAQTGGTEVLNNIVAYYMKHDPAPTLMVQPTLDMAKAWSQDRFSPMLRDTPALTGLVQRRSRDNSNTLLHKTFPGGHITIAGANSPASLASRPVRILLFDECDRYPLSAGNEGDPMSLGRKRTTTFWNKLVVNISTPTIKGESRIEHRFELSTMEYYFVPCPHCGEMQRLVWAKVKWPKGEPHNAWYECQKCEEEIYDKHLHPMLLRGEWRATNEEASGRHRGFHINELYSPWVPFGAMATAFFDAKGDSEKLQTWVNTSLGETWEEQTEKIDYHPLYRRREHYTEVPEEVQVITAGIDTQDDRFEFEICGWADGEESWSINYKRLYGVMSRSEIWNLLAQQLRRPFRRADGVLLNVRMACIDSGGHFTDEVYKFSKFNGPTFIVPTKGSSEMGKPVAVFPRKPNAKGVYLTLVGTDTAKELVYNRYLLQDPGPGYCHWPVSEEYDEDYFKQATAEEKVKKMRRGLPYIEWNLRAGRRNEALDCRVLNLVAIRLLQQHGGVDLTQRILPNAAPKQTKRRRSSSGYW